MLCSWLWRMDGACIKKQRSTDKETSHHSLLIFGLPVMYVGAIPKLCVASRLRAHSSCIALRLAHILAFSAGVGCVGCVADPIMFFHDDCVVKKKRREGLHCIGFIIAARDESHRHPHELYEFAMNTDATLNTELFDHHSHIGIH